MIPIFGWYYVYMCLPRAVGTVFEIDFLGVKTLHLRSIFWGKTTKMVIFGSFFEFSFLFWQNFQKLKKPFLIGLEWSIMAKGEVAISKTVPTVASRYIIIIIHTYQPNLGITYTKL